MWPGQKLYGRIHYGYTTSGSCRHASLISNVLPSFGQRGRAWKQEIPAPARGSGIPTPSHPLTHSHFSLPACAYFQSCSQALPLPMLTVIWAVCRDGSVGSRALTTEHTKKWHVGSCGVPPPLKKKFRGLEAAPPKGMLAPALAHTHTVHKPLGGYMKPIKSFSNSQLLSLLLPLQKLFLLATVSKCKLHYTRLCSWLILGISLRLTAACQGVIKPTLPGTAWIRMWIVSHVQPFPVIWGTVH